MVAGHGKLALFLLDDEIVKVLLQRELISKPHAVVIDAKAYCHAAVGTWLIEVNGKFVIVVANGLILPPHGSPGVVIRGNLAIGDGETVEQIGLVHALAGMLVGSQLKAHVAGIYHHLALVEHFIGGSSALVEREPQLHVGIGREHFLCPSRQHRQECRYCR